MNKKFLLLLIFYFISLSSVSAQEKESSEKNAPDKSPMFCVIIHSPGPNWIKDIPFREQPGVGEHVQYMRRQLEKGLLLIGGPFPDNTGGMMVTTISDIDEAVTIAEADPAVKSGLLNVKVKQWMIPMSAVDLTGFINK